MNVRSNVSGKGKIIAAAAIILLISAAVSNAEIRIPTQPTMSGMGSMTDLISPIKHLLSGRAWMIVEGIDPGLMKRPDWDTLTRLDWRSIGGTGSGGAPTTQAASGFMVPYRSAAPAFSRNILISRDFSNSPMQTEPHIAIDPDDSDHAVVGMIDYNFPSTTSYVTMDGGVTWEGPYQAGYLPDDMVSGGDPVVAFDSKGHVYMTSISIGVEEFTIGPLNTSTMVSSIAISRSEDGGYSWPYIVSTARSGVTLSEQQLDASGRLRGNVSVGFLDKPWLIVGKDPNRPGREILYVTYIDFEVFYQISYMGEIPILLPNEMASTVRLVTSEDSGISWSDPVAVSPTVRRVYGEAEGGSSAPGRFGTDRVVQGPRPVVDTRTGELFVFWLDSTDDGSMEGLGEIFMARSADAGKTFSEPQVTVAFNEIPFTPRNAYFRYWGASFPRAAIGPNGELYVIYTGRPTEKPHDDGDIFFIRSLDKGKTWSNPIRLNDDEGNALQFFPEIDTSPDGTIHVMWADMRDDPTHIRYHIYYTTSADGGKSWGFENKEFGFRTLDTRVTDFASNPNKAFPYGLFIGDYFGLAASDEDVYMVWADSRLGEFGGINQKIAFSRRRAIRSPDIFISPSAGAGGQAVTIQGFNFQPDMNVVIQLQDTAIASARTNRDGRFTSRIYVPVTGEGTQTVNVFDESGNYASTSFYTEFGFGNIEELYRDLLDEVRKLNEKID